MIFLWSFSNHIVVNAEMVLEHFPAVCKMLTAPSPRCFFFFQIWVRKTSDSTKMRIYLGQLQRGAFVIRRRSAAWTRTPPLPHCPDPAIHSPWIHLIVFLLFSYGWPEASGVFFPFFSELQNRLKVSSLNIFPKSSPVVIVCTADGWSNICHRVARVWRQHNITNLFHIIQP